MKDIIKFIFFIMYLMCIFYINKFFILLILLFINFFIIILLHLNWKMAIKIIVNLLPFVIFTIIFNSLFSGIIYGFYIGIRLVIAYEITYIFTNAMTIKEITNAIIRVISLLGFLNIDTQQIEIIISLTINILPNMFNEIEQKVYSVKSKLYKIKIKNIIRILNSMCISIIIKTNEYENALMAKGYGLGK